MIYILTILFKCWYLLLLEQAQEPVELPTHPPCEIYNQNHEYDNVFQDLVLQNILHRSKTLPYLYKLKGRHKCHPEWYDISKHRTWVFVVDTRKAALLQALCNASHQETPKGPLPQMIQAGKLFAIL